MSQLMKTLDVLVWLAIVGALVAAVMGFMKLRTFQLTAAVISGTLLASSALLFYLSFVRVLARTDLAEFQQPGGFIGEWTGGGAISIHEVWGPMSAFWLVLLAFAIQVAGIFLISIVRKPGQNNKMPR